MDSLSKFLQELRDNGYEPVAELRVDQSTWGRLMFNGESRAKASGGYRITQNPDGSFFANYGSSKDQKGWRSWRSNSSREMTWQEISAEKAARIEHRKHVEERERLRYLRVAQRLQRVVSGLPVAESHPYLTDKRINPHGARLRKKTGDLVIPRFGADYQIWSIQTIRQKQPGVKSWKTYFKGALGKGLYFPINSAANPERLMILCEGYATGCSIGQATGWATFVCFDTAGLVEVAKILRARHPDARMIIAADNDQWVFDGGKKPRDLDTGPIAGDDPRWQTWRTEEKLYNPGVEKAQTAAAAVGGAHVLIPDFTATHPKKLTDFNDLVLEKGAEYVKSLFEKILEIPQVTLADSPDAQASGEAPPSVFGESQIPDVQAEGASPDQRLGDMGMAFRVLGYNEGIYYYYPFALRQIVGLTAAGHSMPNLMQLDSLESWEKRWRGTDGKLMAKHQTIALYAAENLMSIAKRRGVFIEESQVRGTGCWIDDGRVVLHCGEVLYVDGRFLRFDDMQSEYTYVASPKLIRPAREALTNHEARRLRIICEAITWENQLSGTLLAGWLVVAPVCAALTYRPHVYITGEAESGKSTVMDRIIKPVLGRLALCVDGGTTEPSLRELMGYNGRPLVYDEAEPSPTMIEVISLARKASTGAVVKKFGQPAFKARFCACFSAINPPVNKTADESRISFMHLKKNRRTTAIQEYDDLLTAIEETITPDFADRLIARTLENMDSLISNIRTFQRAVRRTTGGARASQQVGTMLAGVYLLGRTDKVTDAAAEAIVQKFSWSDHTIIDEEGDPIRLVQWIAGSLVRTRGGAEESIGELVQKVRIENDATSDKMLRYYGIAVKADRVEVASRSQNLAKLLRDTEWHEKWSRTLSDVPGAEKRKIAYFSLGIKTSAISLPIELFIQIDERPVSIWQDAAPPIEGLEL